jgi:hypothetical protein
MAAVREVSFRAAHDAIGCIQVRCQRDASVRFWQSTEEIHPTLI